MYEFLPQGKCRSEVLGFLDVQRRPAEIKMRYKRETLQDMTRPLKQWLYKNRSNPYPSKGQKVQLADESRMTMTQVSNWFANARRRLKNTVRGGGAGGELTWETRVSLYNDNVKGQQEVMDVSGGGESDDSAWESGDDDAKDSPMAENQCQPESAPQTTSQTVDQPAIQPVQQQLPGTCQVPKLEPGSCTERSEPTKELPSTKAESISLHIERAIQKELTSAEIDDDMKPVVSKQVQDVFENVTALEVKPEPVAAVKQEPVHGSDETGCLPSTFPVSSGALSLKEQQLLSSSSNISPLQCLNPTLASRLSEPIKSENTPNVPPVAAETMAAAITNQIAYLMAASNMGLYPMMPFGLGQYPVLTPQMQEELRQHTMLMQAHAAELRKQQQAAAEQLQDSDHQLSEQKLPNMSSQMNSPQSAVFHSSQAPPSFSDTCCQTPLSPHHAASADVSRSDSHELAPSPAQSDDLSYPKSETPKFKNTLLQRYLQGDKTLYTEQQPPESHSVTMVTPLNSPNHQPHSFSPLDLRKRVRNLSGSMGSQEYEDISECETDGMTSPHHVASREHDVTQQYPSVFDELAKRWREVNRGAEPTKDDEEKDDLMLKEVSAIFTLANLATSRHKSTQQT